MNTIVKDQIRFRGKISKMGERFVIYVPKALHEMIKGLIGKDVLVIIEEVESYG
jgi:antitoxin component of MazEF toxin-antitoxin module